MDIIYTLANWIQKPLEYKPEIGTNDIVSWVLAFIGGLIVYRIVDGFQTRIARHTMVREIEELINTMLSSDLAISWNSNKDDYEPVNMRTILDDTDCWENCKDEKPIIVKNQRYIKIRTRKEDQSIDLISTRAVHEYVLLFRRIEKLYKDGIVKSIDMSDMWREILPFASSGRLCFFSSYLSVKDIEPLAYVVSVTLHGLKKQKNDAGLEYFKKHNSKEDLRIYYLNNRRFRVVDWFSKRYIEKILSALI